jgi:hypothetical protein
MPQLSSWPSIQQSSSTYVDCEAERLARVVLGGEGRVQELDEQVVAVNLRHVVLVPLLLHAIALQSSGDG